MPFFLNDECVPRAVHEALSRAGQQIALVRDLLPGAIDEDVLAFARSHGQVVLTEDRRFGFIAIGAGPPSSVVVLLLGDTAPSEKAARLLSVLPGILDTLADAVTVIGPTSVRRRPL